MAGSCLVYSLISISSVLLQDIIFETYVTRSPNPFAGTAAALAALRTTSIFANISNDQYTKLLSELYLHGTLVDQHSVELNEGVIGAACFAESDSCNAAAHTVGSVGEQNSLDMANRFAKILL